MGEPSSTGIFGRRPEGDGDDAARGRSRDAFSVLVIEDSPSDSHLVRVALESWAQVTCLPRLEAALQRLSEAEFDVALVDLNLPDARGLDVVHRVREASPDLPVVVLTGTQGVISYDAIANGAQDFLSKDELEPSRLARAVLFAVERQALKAQGEARARELEAILSTAADPTLLLTRDARLLVWANAAAEELFGTDGVRRLRAGPGLTEAQLQGAVEGELECALQGCEVGVRAAVATWGERPVWHVSLRDLQARRASEEARERLLEGERLIALGQMSASVAHEINNPLAAIIANLGSLESDEPAVTESLEAARRVASIVDDLRTFARVGETSVTRATLDDVARSALNLLSSRISGAPVEVRTDLGGTPSVLAFEGRLVQIAANFLSNALDAVLESGGREIVVGTARTPDGVMLFVEDDGPGMDETVREAIFTPFFTTRGHRGGMGLGLSVCLEMAQRHRGRIEVHSTPGRGARVELHLPLDTGLRLSRPTAPPEVQNARILLVDDDRLVRRAHQRQFAPHFQVVTAGSGAEALEILARDRAFDLIVCDVQMPTMSGPDLFERVRAELPDIADRFVLCSAGVYDPEAIERLQSSAVSVIPKPLETSTLCELLERQAARETR